MVIHEIYKDEMHPQPVVGKIFEDCRYRSPTLHCQFRVVDIDNGVVSVQELQDD